MEVALVLPAYVVAVNVATYQAFAVDKRRARDRGWRLSEATLLRLAIVGGSIGAKLAQRRLRHKTRKQPFAKMLNCICGAQALLIVLAALSLGHQPLGLAEVLRV